MSGKASACLGRLVQGVAYTYRRKSDFCFTKSYLRRLVAFRTLSMFSNLFFSSICWRGTKGGGG